MSVTTAPRPTSMLRRARPWVWLIPAVAALVVVVPAVPAVASTSSSPVYSGYLGTASVPFTRATGHYRVPTVTCTNPGSDENIHIQWIALSGNLYASVELRTYIACKTGTPTGFTTITEFDDDRAGNGGGSHRDI